MPEIRKPRKQCYSKFLRGEETKTTTGPVGGILLLLLFPSKAENNSPVGPTRKALPLLPSLVAKVLKSPRTFSSETDCLNASNETQTGKGEAAEHVDRTLFLICLKPLLDFSAVSEL